MSWTRMPVRLDTTAQSLVVREESTAFELRGHSDLCLVRVHLAEPDARLTLW